MLHICSGPWPNTITPGMNCWIWQLDTSHQSHLITVWGEYVNWACLRGGPLPVAVEREALSRGLSLQWLATYPPEVCNIAPYAPRTRCHFRGRRIGTSLQFPWMSAFWTSARVMRLSSSSRTMILNCTVTASCIAAQLVKKWSLSKPRPWHVSKEYTSQWCAQSVDTDPASYFSYEELTMTLKQRGHGRRLAQITYMLSSWYTPVIMPKKGYESSSTHAYNRVSYQGYGEPLLLSLSLCQTNQWFTQ